jgi:hypothetical protein
VETGKWEIDSKAARRPEAADTAGEDASATTKSKTWCKAPARTNTFRRG